MSRIVVRRMVGCVFEVSREQTSEVRLLGVSDKHDQSASGVNFGEATQPFNLYGCRATADDA